RLCHTASRPMAIKGGIHYYMAPMAPRFSARGGSASLFGGSGGNPPMLARPLHYGIGGFA
ncbi:MAG: hypothetical protein L6420_11020, partial [Elusimicrobia bacterium]|nr:hypothetical protein [Elusimicrobiota bacterium]